MTPVSRIELHEHGIHHGIGPFLVQHGARAGNRVDAKPRQGPHEQSDLRLTGHVRRTLVPHEQLHRRLHLWQATGDRRGFGGLAHGVECAKRRARVALERFEVGAHHVARTPGVARTLLPHAGHELAPAKRSAHRRLEEWRQRQGQVHGARSLAIDGSTRKRDDTSDTRGMIDGQVQRHGRARTLRDHDDAAHPERVQHRRDAVGLTRQRVVRVRGFGGPAHPKRIDHHRRNAALGQLCRDVAHGERRSNGSGNQNNRR